MIEINEVRLTNTIDIAHGIVPIQAWLLHLFEQAAENRARVWVHIDWDREWVKYHFATFQECVADPTINTRIYDPRQWS